LEDSDDVLEIAEWHLAVSYIGNKASSTSLLSNLFTLKVLSTAMVDEIGFRSMLWSASKPWMGMTESVFAEIKVVL